MGERLGEGPDGAGGAGRLLGGAGGLRPLARRPPVGGQLGGAVTGPVGAERGAGGEGDGEEAMQAAAFGGQHRSVDRLPQELVAELVPGPARVDHEQLSVDRLGQGAVEGAGVEQAQVGEQFVLDGDAGGGHGPEHLGAACERLSARARIDAAELGRQGEAVTCGGELLGEERVALRTAHTASTSVRSGRRAEDARRSSRHLVAAEAVEGDRRHLWVAGQLADPGRGGDDRGRARRGDTCRARAQRCRRGCG